MPSTRVLVLVGLTLFAFWRPLFAGGTLAPDDQLWLSDPFNADAPADLTIEVAERDAAAIHGWWLGWADDVRSGELHWFRDVGAGEPLLAEGLPITHLAYLVVPGWYAPGLVGAIAVLLAALGAMRLSDRRGLAPVAGLFAGLVYGFSGLVFAWIGWPHATAIALAPWVIGALLDLADEPDGRRAFRAGLITAAQLWCGVFAISIFTVLGGLAWFAADAIRKRDRRGLFETAGAVALGFAFAAPHLWPRWERWSWADTSHLDDIADTGAPAIASITTLFGSALGNESVGLAWVESSSFQLSVAFVGAAAMSAFVLALVMGRPLTGPLALGAIGVAIAYVGGPFETMSDLVVGSGSLASHARVLVVLAVAVGAAVGVDALVDPATTPAMLRERLSRRHVRIAAAGVGLVVAAGLVVWFDVVRDARALRVVAAQSLATAGVLVIVVMAVGSWVRGRVTGVGVAVGLVVVAAFELLAFGMPVPTVTDRGERPVATAAHDALIAVLDDQGRIAGDHDAFSPDTAARFGIADVRAPGLRSTGEIDAFIGVDPSSVLAGVGGGPFEPVVRVRDDADPFGAEVWDLLGVDAWVLPRDATPPGPRIDPQPETRTAWAAASPLGTLVVPEHGLRAVVLDLRIPAFTRIGLDVETDGVVASSDTVIRRPADGLVAVPIAGEALSPGAEARVVVTVDSRDEPAEVGTIAGGLALGAIGGDPRSELVWTDQALIVARPTPRVVWQGTTAGDLTVTTEEPDRLVVDVVADGEGLLRTDVIAEPGWSARLDGRSVPTEHIEGVVVAVDVPAGRHVVEFDYRPPRFGSGVLVAIAGLVLGAIWMTVERRRPSREA